jgi:hypothetical protein
MTVMGDKNHKTQNYGKAVMVGKRYLRCVWNAVKEDKAVPVRNKRHAMQEYLHILLT